jgi:hypothetical protein
MIQCLKVSIMIEKYLNELISNVEIFGIISSLRYCLVSSQNVTTKKTHHTKSKHVGVGGCPALANFIKLTHTGRTVVAQQ